MISFTLFSTDNGRYGIMGGEVGAGPDADKEEVDCLTKYFRFLKNTHGWSAIASTITKKKMVQSINTFLKSYFNAVDK
jgi:hypothetical protein